MIIEAKALLARAARGDEQAEHELAPIIYDELREQAQRFVRDIGRGSITLQPTAVVHEAYLKLINADPGDFQSRTHFVAVASRAMRQVLLDHLRAKGRQKRGGDWKRITLSHAAASDEDSGIDLEDLDQALDELANLDERAARVVEYRFFGGMTIASVAALLDVSERTVRNDWLMARAWLRTRLGRSDGASEE